MNTPRGRRRKPKKSGTQELREQITAVVRENLPNVPNWTKQVLNLVNRFYIWWLLAAVAFGLLGMVIENRWVLMGALAIILVPTLLLEWVRRIAEAAGKTAEKAVNAAAVPHTWIAVGIYCIFFVLPDTAYYKLLSFGIISGIMIFMILMGRWHRPTWWYQGITMIVVATPPIIFTGQILGHTFFPKPYTKVQIAGAQHLHGGEVKIVTKGTICFADDNGQPDFDDPVTARPDDWTVYVTDTTNGEGLETYFMVYQGGRNPKLRGVRTLWVGASDLQDPTAPPTTRAQAMAAGLAPTPLVRVGDTLMLTQGELFFLDDRVEPDLNHPRRSGGNYRTTVTKVVNKDGRSYAQIKLTNVRDQNGVLCPVMYLWVRLA